MTVEKLCHQALWNFSGTILYWLSSLISHIIVNVMMYFITVITIRLSSL